MSIINLHYQDQAAAIADMVRFGIALRSPAGDNILPTVTTAPDGTRVDIIVAGDGSGVTLDPAGHPLAGFRLSVNWSGPTPPNFGTAVATDFGAAFLPPGEHGPVPEQVPLWAAQAALEAVGKYDAVNAAILQMKASNPPVYLAWTMGNYASRTSAFIGMLAAGFGMTDADIDAVFRAADEIAAVAG